MNRAARAAWPALTIVVALGVPLAVVPAVAGDPSPLLLVRAVLAVVFALAAAAVLGASTAGVVLPREDARRGRLLDAAGAAAAVWTVAAAGTAFSLYLDDAPSVSSASFGPGFVAFLSDIAVGRTWTIATIAGAVLTALLLAVRSRVGVALLLAAAAGALIPVALLDASSGTDLTVQRTTASSTVVQLVGTGVWLGLVALSGPLGLAARRVSAVLLLSGGLAVGAVALGAAAEVRSGAPVGLLAVRGGVLLLALVATVARRGAGPWTSVPSVLLGAAVGLAAATSVLRTAPAEVLPRTSPAEILTGAPLPPRPSAARLLAGWQPDVIALLLAVVLLVGYAVALVALRRRGTRWSVGRTAAWVLGVVVLIWLTSGGPSVYQAVLLSAHLAQHVALVTAVPLLLALGAPGRLLAAVRPVGVPRAAAPVLLGPVPAAVLAVAGLLALYGTGMLRWSVADPLGTEEAVLQCLLTGVLLARALLAADRRTGTLVGLAVLVLATVAAAVLVVGPGVLLPDWFGAMGWGTDALADQRVGAVVAWAVALGSTVGLLVLVRIHGRRREPLASPAPRRVLQDEVTA